MKKILAVFVIIFVATSVPAYSFFNSDVKKAKEFMSVDMFPEAIELLKKRINEKPTDGEAHYQLGLCYLKTNSLSAADESFSRAVKISSDYNTDIAKAYRMAGDDKVGKGNLPQAQQMYSRAIQYNPSLRGQIAQECFDKGIASLQKPYLDIAISLDSTYKMKSNNQIMDKAGAVSDETCLRLYQMAAGYCGKGCERSQEAGKRLLSISKKIEDKDVFDGRIEQYKDAARQFIDVPPSVVVYEPREKPYEFDLEKGEIIDHWIASPENMDIHDGFYSSNKQYVIYLKQSKRVIRIWKNEKMPKKCKDDLKFRAVDQIIIALFRKKTII